MANESGENEARLVETLRSQVDQLKLRAQTEQDRHQAEIVAVQESCDEKASLSAKALRVQIDQLQAQLLSAHAVPDEVEKRDKQLEELKKQVNWLLLHILWPE